MSDSLNTAFAKAEADLPPGAFIRLGRLLVTDHYAVPQPQDITDHYEARAHIWDEKASGYSSYISGEGETPADALLALRVALRANR